MMKYKDALKQCKRVGTAHAGGDALRAMYAGLIALSHGGDPAVYYGWLQRNVPGDDCAIAAKARELIRDRQSTLDALFAAGV